MNGATDRGAAILDSLLPELRKLFKDIPQFGELTFTACFYEGEVVRIEQGATISRKLPPKAART